MRKTAIFAVIAAAIWAVTSVVSCSDSNDNPTFDAKVNPSFDANTTPDATTVKPCSVNLTPTSDVQAALIAATSGQVICFGNGTYALSEELTLTVDGVTLRGQSDRSKVVLDFAGQLQADNPNALFVNGADDFVIEGLTVKDSAGDGIRVNDAHNVTFRNVKVFWTAVASTENGAYGLYPVGSTNVLIDNCEVVGASDAGIYVGQSSNVMVRNSRAEGNVAGIEIENTDDAEVHDNVSKGNVSGILVFNLPNLPRKTGSRTKVHHNTIETNNISSFAAEGSIVSLVPTGTGMVLFANDNGEVHNNTFTGNVSTGITIVACSTVAVLAQLGGGTLNCGDGAYDGFPEGMNIHDNTFTNNGTAPTGFFNDVLWTDKTKPLQDIIWDGTVDANKPATPENKLCIKNNGAATFLGNALSTPTTDLAPHDCTHDPLPGINVTW